jgi:hypothetical protein
MAANGNIGRVGQPAGFVPFQGRGNRLNGADGGNPWNCWCRCAAPSLPKLNDAQKETLKKVGIALMVIALVATLFTTSFASKGAMGGTLYSQVSLAFSAMGLIGAVTYAALSAENKKRFGIFLTVVFVALTTLFALSTAHVISPQVPMITIWTVEGLLAITMTVLMCYRFAKMADQALDP